jgi:hypothetical protein
MAYFQSRSSNHSCPTQCCLFALLPIPYLRCGPFGKSRQSFRCQCGEPHTLESSERVAEHSVVYEQHIDADEARRTLGGVWVGAHCSHLSPLRETILLYRARMIRLHVISLVVRDARCSATDLSRQGVCRLGTGAMMMLRTTL